MQYQTYNEDQNLSYQRHKLQFNTDQLTYLSINLNIENTTVKGSILQQSRSDIDSRNKDSAISDEIQ